MRSNSEYSQFAGQADQRREPPGRSRQVIGPPYAGLQVAQVLQALSNDLFLFR
ncbi:MAG: hypothetical protein IIB57_11870 [Planctomycetes bacterium]|nr:hypothetical protein [Planctomycetota bacterium]